MRAKYISTGGRREPEEISEILGKVIESAAVGVDVRQAMLVRDWGSFVPGDWGSARPVGVRDGVLLVAVPDGSVGSLLRYQTDALLTAIDDQYGEGLITSVRLQIERP